MSTTQFGYTQTIEVGFASNPTVALASTTWTDISAYARVGQTYRGRGSELVAFQAGTAQIVLLNADRRFDPSYSAGPYFGNLLPMRRIRIKHTYNAVTYATWSGFVLDWPQSYDIGNHYAEVSIQAVDAFGALNRLKLPESVWAVTILADTPAGWWRLGEQYGTSALDSSGNAKHGVYLGGATFDTRTGLVVGSSDNAIGFDGIDDAAKVAPALTGFPCSIEGWVEFTSGGALGSLIYWQGSFDFSTGIALYTNTTGSISAQATFLPPTSSIAAVTTATTFGDGKPHHLVATFVDASTAPLIYVDGVAQATTPTVLGTPCPFAANQAYVGSAPTAALGSLFAGTVDEVAVYNSVLSSGHVLDHYNQGTIPWVGDTVATRAARYLTLVGWPSADQDLNGATVLQQVALGRLPALTALQDLERAEQGQLYIDGIGKIEFRDRYWRYTDSHAITSQATFGDAGIGLELGYSDLVTDGGEQFIANTVITQRFGGGEQTREDVTSQTMFYERTLSITGLQNSDDADVGYIADWQLATHKNVIQRVTQLSVRPLGNPAALFPVVLGLDIGQRVTVKRRPQGVGAVLTYTMLVEGIVHTFDATGEWTTTFYLSSADSTLLTGIYDDAVYGLYDSAVFAP